MSDSEPVDLQAFRQLERLVRSLGEEMASFRRRAQTAEARLKELEATGAHGAPSTARLADLERENKDLRARLDGATSQVRRMLDRVRFLRQQQTTGGER